MITSKLVFIVVGEFNETMAKRQPWYTVRFFHGELQSRGYEVRIVSCLEEIPLEFCGEVIKVLSLKDFLYGLKKKDYNYKLTYLCTLPLYNVWDILRCGPSVLFRNFQDLWRLLLVSLLPRFWLTTVLSKASRVVFLSDIRVRKFEKLSNAFLVIPFIRGNWPEIKELSFHVGRAHRLVYVGPPFETRGIDVVSNFSKELFRYDLKIIIRLERKELRRRFARYENNFPNAQIVTGMLTREQLFQELSDCSIAILPFKLVMSECPIVVLEAIELGLHVITTRECGISSIGNFPGIILSQRALSQRKSMKQLVTEIQNVDTSREMQKSCEFLDAIEEINENFWKKNF